MAGRKKSVPTKPQIDFRQVRKLAAALYEPDDWFYSRVYTETGADAVYADWIHQKMAQRCGKYGFQSGWMYDPDVATGWRALVERYNGVEKMAFALSLGTFNLLGGRKQEECCALSAFGIDIDPKDFDRLKRGAESIDDIIDVVLERYRKRGLVPHALVDSGHGLHVYFLINRVRFGSNEERTAAKDTWWRLTHVVGGARDRFDLASILRAPGTINWKNGEPTQVRFIKEHTDLTRPRYDAADIATRVTDLPSLPPHLAVGVRPTSRTGNQRPADGGGNSDPLSDRDQQMLDLALALDPSLGAARATALLPDIGHRSEHDFAYACRLLRVGLPESVVIAELEGTHKARERANPREYAQLTFSRARGVVWRTGIARKQDDWRELGASWQAFYTSRKDAADTRQSVEPSRTAPSVSVVLARAGDGKTRGIVNELSSRRWYPSHRAAMLGLFIRELLHHEYMINVNFPEGFAYEDGLDNVWEAHDTRPKTHLDLFDRLQSEAPEVAACWPLERLQRLVEDPAAFYVNSRHPVQLDNRFEPQGEDDAFTPPLGVDTDLSPWVGIPMAVVKFRGREDLCLAGLTDNELQSAHPPCSKCRFTSCRANTGTEARSRGAKTYWRQAPVALLSHRAFITQALFAPELNEFDTLIVDEMPDFVYRHAKISVKRVIRQGRDAWNVEPLDSILNVIGEARHEAERSTSAGKDTVLDRLRTIGERISAFRKALTMLAIKTRKAVTKGTSVTCERIVDTRPPILSLKEFDELIGLTNTIARDDEDDEERGKRATYSEALATLRDFCSDEEALDVYLEQAFSKATEKGTMWMYRPVDGWTDLLGNPDGVPREVILLDATAGIDPRYQLQGQFADERIPAATFANTTVVLVGAMTKTKANEAGAQKLVADMVESLREYMDALCGGKLLILTNKGMEAELRDAVEVQRSAGKLPTVSVVAHFGALRGRNDYDDFDAVYLTHPHRYEESYYVGLQMLLHGFEGFPRQWANKNLPSWPAHEHIAARAMICDLYQDVMRIGIRRDPTRRAFIFIPTQKASHVVRLMRLFDGATFVLPDGRRFETAASSRSAAAGADRGSEVQANIRTNSGVKTGLGWGTARFNE